jgi:hypothetical protein
MITFRFKPIALAIAAQSLAFALPVHAQVEEAAKEKPRKYSRALEEVVVTAKNVKKMPTMSPSLSKHLAQINLPHSVSRTQPI